MLRFLFRILLFLKVFAACLFHYPPLPAAGQGFEVPVVESFIIKPVGSGARALGMGGAFIAVADDATAASWNPGGLIQLERPEFSVAGDFFHLIEDNNFRANPEASGEQSVSKASLNFLSLTYPFSLGRFPIAVSLNYQKRFDFERDWDFSLSGTQVSLRQEGAIYAIGTAFSTKLTHWLSFGFMLNIWEDPLNQNELKQQLSQKRPGFEFKERQKISFSGFNAKLGMLFHPTSRLTLGAVFETPFRADWERKVETSGIGETFDEKLDMPMSYGIGLAYRFSDQLTVSADISRTEWSDFVLITSEGNKFSGISGLPTGESDVDATYDVRIGAEYLFIWPKFVIPLRAGVFYDPVPAEGSPDNLFGFSLGSGIAARRFAFDAAYQYKFGNDVDTLGLSVPGFSQDIEEHTLSLSLLIYF